MRGYSFTQHPRAAQASKNMKLVSLSQGSVFPRTQRKGRRKISFLYEMLLNSSACSFGSRFILWLTPVFECLQLSWSVCCHEDEVWPCFKRYQEQKPTEDSVNCAPSSGITGADCSSVLLAWVPTLNPGFSLRPMLGCESGRVESGEQPVGVGLPKPGKQQGKKNKTTTKSHPLLRTS